MINKIIAMMNQRQMPIAATQMQLSPNSRIHIGNDANKRRLGSRNIYRNTRPFRQRSVTGATGPMQGQCKIDKLLMRLQKSVEYYLGHDAAAHVEELPAAHADDEGENCDEDYDDDDVELHLVLHGHLFRCQESRV